MLLMSSLNLEIELNKESLLQSPLDLPHLASGWFLGIFKTSNGDNHKQGTVLRDREEGEGTETNPTTTTKANPTTLGMVSPLGK